MRPLILVLALALLAVPSEALAGSTAVTINAKTITLNTPIYFEVGKPAIKKESFPVLDALAAALAADTHLTLVEIQSHTDARGNDKFNLEISQKRADAIQAYLVGKGVDAKRLRATGYGETKPLDKNNNVTAWAKNRRTAFVILQRTK